jgi:hypothetical protein
MQRKPKISAVNLPNDFIFGTSARSPWAEVRKWQPSNLEDFVFVLELDVQSPESNGGDIFSICICSQKRFEETGSTWKSQFTLVTRVFSWPQIKNEVEARFNECLLARSENYIEGLRTAFFWEFEEGWPSKEKPKPYHLGLN